MHRIDEIINGILEELESAKRQHPRWPIDPFHALGFLSEEVGEATQAAVDAAYHRGDPEHVCEELVQAATVIFRFLMNWERYQWKEAYDETD